DGCAYDHVPHSARQGPWRTEGYGRSRRNFRRAPRRAERLPRVARDPGAAVLCDLPDLDAASAQLADVVIRWHRHVGRLHALPARESAHLRLTGDRQGITGCAFHGTDAVCLVHAIDEVPLQSVRPAALLTLDFHAQCNEVGRRRLLQAWLGDRDEHIAWNHTRALHVDGLEIDQAEITDRSHDVGVSGIAQCLVLHG